MDVFFSLVILNLGLFVGYTIGRHQGSKNGYMQGLLDGAESTLNLLEKHQLGELISPLDIETARKLLNQKMGLN